MKKRGGPKGTAPFLWAEAAGEEGGDLRLCLPDGPGCGVGRVGDGGLAWGIVR